MSSKEFIKQTGATFTPSKLAEFLAFRLFKYIDVPSGKELKILDPACGDGELLVALDNICDNQDIDYSMQGFDVSFEYLSIAKERLKNLDPDKLKLVLGNFLELITPTKSQLSLEFLFNDSISLVNNSADVVIANPPYVRTQILGSEQAQVLAKKFNLKGRVDLYYPFLIAMTESLKEGGILGVITSNRYLSTKGGESIRKFLSENYEILELIDLGDTKLFDAAVLPAIFIGKKRKTGRAVPLNPRFIKIYEELNGYKGELKTANSIFDILNINDSGYFKVGEKRYKKTEGILKYDRIAGGTWEMLSLGETKWISSINERASCTIGDIFKVRVGIKTTADKVFIGDKWAELGENMPEVELLKDLLSQENIKPWGMSDEVKLQVLYPHVIENGKKKTINIDEYPKAKRYFLSHEDKLKSRKYVIDAGRDWFEIWVPQNPKLWSKPKLVFPDISLIPRFYFDEGGKIVNGNCYWIVAEHEKDIDSLLLIQGVANSKLMTRYHDLVFNNKLYSGRRRYFTQYVEKYPLPNLESNISKEIIQIVKQLNEATDFTEITKLEENLEVKVAEAFGVTPIFNLD